MNEKGEILLQKRASTRKVNPNIWGKIGGHALAGESTEQAIQREIKEEVGINVSSNSIKLLDIEKIDTEKDCFFAYDYLVLVNYKVEEYVVQKEELSEVKYYTIEEIEKAITTQDPKFIFSQRNTTRLLEKCEILKRERKLILENS